MKISTVLVLLVLVASIGIVPAEAGIIDEIRGLLHDLNPQKLVVATFESSKTSIELGESTTITCRLWGDEPLGVCQIVVYDPNGQVFFNKVYDTTSAQYTLTPNQIGTWKVEIYSYQQGLVTFGNIVVTSSTVSSSSTPSSTSTPSPSPTPETTQSSPEPTPKIIPDVIEKIVGGGTQGPAGTRATPGFESVIAIAGLVIVSLIVLRRDRI